MFCSTFANYGLTVAGVALALIARQLLDPFLGNHLPFVTFFVAVVFATWLGGLRTGLLATGLGFLLALYFFVPPRNSFAVVFGPHAAGLATYFMVSVAIAGFGGAVRAAQRRFAEQGERLQTTLASIGDAVIASDTQGRITSMNPAAERLTGWTTGEAAGQPLEVVYRIINEETHKEVESPAVRALQEGMVVGLANHTLLIAKDGTTRPIDDSAAPIRSAQGEVTGCILIFRDVSQRRQTERELKANAHFIAGILGSITDAFFALDRNWTITFVNDEFVKRFGEPREQIVGRGLWELLPDAIGNEAHVQLLRAMNDRVVVEYEVYHQFWNRWFMDKAYPTRDGGLSIYSRDITDRKQSEQSLRRSEEHLELLSNTVPSLISYIDADRRYKSCNRAYTEWFGLPFEEIVGHSVREVVGEEAWKIVGPNVEKAFAGEMVEYEAEARYSRGGTRWIHAVYMPHRTHDGTIAGVVVMVNDVSKRKAGERARAHLAAIINSSDDAVVSKNLNGIIQSWNQGAERLFGYTAAEAIGQSITMLIPPERIDEEDDILDRIRQGGPFKHYETVRRRKDGSLVDISLTVSPIIDDSGEIIGASKIARDITERKRAEQALREADRRKDEFLATLAHELRNPLAPIRNSLSILKDPNSSRALFERATDVMVRQLKQMVRLIDDLLDLSRISRGKLVLKKERVELAPIVHQAVETSRPLASAANHELVVTLPLVPVYVDADPIRLAQVLSNLLTNSCKFTEAGGRIDLIAQVQGKEIAISVKDNGLGIPPDKIDRIFEMFSQLDQSLEKSQGGLGIGLTLVKRLVELHEGQIEVRSEGAGKGSEFIVRLPIDVTQPETTQPNDDEQLSQPDVRHRILVVDDNRDSAESLAMLLQLKGNETHTAHDGQAALDVAEEHRPDVILLDIGMPKLNGYDVCRRIRERPWGSKPVIIALTGWGQEDDRRRSREAGFDGHLVKPVEHAVLMKLLTSREVKAGVQA